VRPAVSAADWNLPATTPFAAEGLSCASSGRMVRSKGVAGLRDVTVPGFAVLCAYDVPRMKEKTNAAAIDRRPALDTMLTYLT
jgi:hypothetical protein